MTDGDKPHLLESNSGILLLPAGYTSKCQSMEVSLNKPFKTVSRRFWVKYVVSVVEGFPDANSGTTFRVSNSKFNLILYEVELLTRKKNFYKNFRVSNSKCDAILRNSVS